MCDYLKYSPTKEENSNDIFNDSFELNRFHSFLGISMLIENESKRKNNNSRYEDSEHIDSMMICIITISILSFVFSNCDEYDYEDYY